MSCDYYEEFLNELGYVKEQMQVFGVNYDICQTVYALRKKVKEFFPINKAPDDIVRSLNSLEERLNLCIEQTKLICERIEIEVENIRQKAYQNA